MPWIWAIRLGVIGLALWFVFELGNDYGSNARTLAKWSKEIQEANKRLQDYASKDARDAIEEEDRAEQEDQEFAVRLPTLGQCVLTKDQADALNRIGGE
jgi:hypothetical protein